MISVFYISLGSVAAVGLALLLFGATVFIGGVALNGVGAFLIAAGIVGLLLSLLIIESGSTPSDRT